MIKRMAAEVQVMMQHKIDAIKRIMELAENIALDHQYDKLMGHRLKVDVVQMLFFSFELRIHMRT